MFNSIATGLIGFLFVFVGQGVFATTNDFKYAPPPFVAGADVYVPVDIQSVLVQWVVSGDLLRTTGRAEVEFRVQDVGFPFLLLNPNSVVHLDGKPTPIKKMEAAPFLKSSYFALMTKVLPGLHRMTVDYSFNTDPNETHFLPNKYHSNSFVEAGIPCNLQFDHFKLLIEITFEGTQALRVIANGEVKNLAPDNNGRKRFQISFPEQYTSMSFFIDLIEEALLEKRERVLKSIDGRDIPVLVYSHRDDVGKELLLAYLSLLVTDLPRLERMFGPYPYNSIIFKSSQKKGGGAYAGAVALQRHYVSHVIHEIGHSWFMESVSPSHGNDQWLHEGLGSWSPTYQRGPEQNEKFKKSIDVLSNPYTLTQTSFVPNTSAHSSGEAVLSALDTRLESKGGLVKFLKQIHEIKKGQTLSTREFKALLETLTGVVVTDIFEYYFVSY